MDEYDFFFCPKCGEGLHPDEHRSLACNSCGLRMFVNPKPTNAAIIRNKEGAVLLVKRKLDPKKGFWDVPGGFVDIKETIEQSVEREIHEELCAKVESMRYVGSTNGRYLFGEINYYSVCMWFEVALDNEEEIESGDDVVEVAWFDENEIPWDRIAFKGVVDGLKNWL
ncbi:NUDIX domain-containing protein [Candidatus Woesebacteria bacterium]|nr:NUDIX domain-containing protein [Candidatus Woesebacteria bacterium]